MFQVLEAFDLDLVVVAEVNKERLFFYAIIFGWNFNLFLTAIDMDDFEPFVGGVWIVCDDLFDDGGDVDTANNIDKGLEVEGFPTTCFGVTFDELVNLDLINNGNVDDEVKTAGFSRPWCGDTFFHQSATAMLMMRSKQWNFHVPDVAKQFFRVLTTQSDDWSTYHLEFWVKYSTSMAWLDDEVGIYPCSPRSKSLSLNIE